MLDFLLSCPNCPSQLRRMIVLLVPCKCHKWHYAWWRRWRREIGCQPVLGWFLGITPKGLQCTPSVLESSGGWTLISPVAPHAFSNIWLRGNKLTNPESKPSLKPYKLEKFCLGSWTMLACSFSYVAILHIWMRQQLVTMFVLLTCLIERWVGRLRTGSVHHVHFQYQPL